MQHRIPVETLGDDGPAMARAVSACVHCGFCLPACPTYRVLGEEMDSPRGRIVLMKGVLEGALDAAEAAPYIDRCLGCLACESACPSGVPYRELLEPFRGRLRARRSWWARARLGVLLRVIESPAAFRLAASVGNLARPLGRMAPTSVNDMLRLLPSRLPPVSTPPAFTPAQGTRRGRVAVMTGCAQSVLRPAITEATVRVLAANGVDVVVPARQGCCGALARHAGDLARGAALAAAHRAGFPNDVDAILTTAAGCGSSMKDHPASGPAVLDVTEYLDQIGLRGNPRLRRPTTVAYQDACHLTHGQQVTAPPRRLLERIEGVALVPVADAGLCCGSAGLYNLEQPALAADLGRRKAATLIAAGADYVVSGNIGCLTQLQPALGARGVPLLHTMALLDMAYRTSHESQ